MRKKKVGGTQTSLFSSETPKQKENVEFLKARLRVAVASVQLAKQLSEDAGLWGHHLERYHNRLDPSSWWLHVELHMSEEYPDAPKLEDYSFGSYGMHDPGIDEYVKDRAKWILPQLEEEMRSYLFELKNQEARGKIW